MKKIPLLLFLHLFFVSLYASETENSSENLNTSAQISKPEIDKEKGDELEVRRAGFIGVGWGSSFPVGNYAGDAQTGLQLDLVNFGYLFSDRIGLRLDVSYGSHQLSSSSSFDEVYLALLAGPLYSRPIKEKVSWDISPMIGLSRVSLSPSYNLAPSAAFAFKLNTGVRYSLRQRLALSIYADYSLYDFHRGWGSEAINALAIKAGISFTFVQTYDK